MNKNIQNSLNEHIRIVQLVKENFNQTIENIALLIEDCLNSGNKIIIFGNGGSASDAQHIAAEFTGRFVKNRKPLAAIAITTDTSAITAIGNDFGFEFIFSRQIEAIAVEGDILLGITTSGNSKNVINAFLKGNEIGTKNIALSGCNGGELNHISILHNIIIPSSVTARIQEIHIVICHLLCEIIDNKYN